MLRLLAMTLILTLPLPLALALTLYLASTQKAFWTSAAALARANSSSDVSYGTSPA